MTRDMRLYVGDILESISKIEQYARTLAEEDFLANTQLQDAVLRRLEIISEAVKSIPQAFRDNYPDIPWRNIAALRDVLIHEYFGVSLHRAWKVVKQDMPDLKQQLLQVQSDLDKDRQGQ